MKIILLFGIFALFSSTSAFKCYQCVYYENDTMLEPGCNQEPVPEKFLLDCKYTGTGGPVKEWQCVKQIGKTIDKDDNENKYVSRSCSPGRSYESTCKKSDALHSFYGVIKKGSLCYCNDKEGCNTATNLSFGIITFVISTFAIAARYII